MDKNFDEKKFKKIVSISFNLAKILYWVCLFGIVITFLAGIVLQFIPESSSIFRSNNEGSLSLTINSMIEYDYSLGNDMHLKPLYNSILLSTMAISIIFSLVIKQLIVILNNVKVNKPFAIENGNCIYRIGIIIIMWSFIYNVVQFYMSSVILELLNNANMTVTFKLNLQMIFIGLLLIILAKIFIYGSYLQDEYDSTL